MPKIDDTHWFTKCAFLFVPLLAYASSHFMRQLLKELFSWKEKKKSLGFYKNLEPYLPKLY
jgi:hypothetical protein